MDTAIEDELFIVGKEATELSKFPVVEYCSDGRWGHFRTADNITFSCSLLQGSFPLENMMSLFNGMQKLPHIKFPSELKGTVDSVVMLASDLSDRSGKFLRVKIEDGEIFIKTENELGWAEKTLSTKYKGETLSININSRFLSQILDKSTSLACEERKVHFSNENFQHIVMMVTDPKESQ
jgi:DNA polymerase III sliding clamp (beta) subunit (PCNA family)